VVAYGTSAPELAVATKTALAHAQPIALGTVIGSCAANISLILGLTALIAPPTIDGRLIRRELPVLLGSAILVPLLLRNGVLSRLEGGILVGCAVLFTIVTLTVSASLDDNDDPASEDAPAPVAPAATPGKVASRTEEVRAIRSRAMTSAEQFAAPGPKRRGSLVVAIVITTAGLLLLVLGSDLFVRGGRGLAAELGMSERLLGLTVIAIGTSLPELIASIVAASRGQAALAVGSVIGSNLLNVFLVLGVTAYLRPIDLGERMHLVELIGLVAITLLGVLMLRGSRRISRFEGGILVAAYVGFIVSSAIW
jgi:cation:H+ antiporter